MKFIEYPDAEMMMIDLADTLASELKNALLGNETVSFAVPGGTTPGPMFDVLCGAAHIDWARVNVMLTDERRVPETHERSNTRLIKQRLLVDAAAAATYVSIVPEGDSDLDALSDSLAPHLPISVMLLGMGADMHTASIFPNSPDLETALTTNLAVAAVQPPDGLEPRITLSARVLNGALNRHIVITGPEKRAAFERAQHLAPHDAPIAAVLAGSTIHWAER